MDDHIDLESFAVEQFSVDRWLNDALDGDHDGGRSAEELLAALQRVEARLDTVWQSISAESVQMLPVLGADLRLAEQCSVDALHRLDGVRDDVRAADVTNAQVVQQLVRIHCCRLNLDALNKCLSDAEQWKALTAEVQAVFSSGDCAVIADHLLRMQHCLEALDKGDSDFAVRCRYLDEVKDQFVSIISPVVISAFSTRSQERLTYFASLFGNLHRKSDLDKLSTGYVKQQLISIWRDQVESSSPQRPVDVLRLLYNVIVDQWLSEVDKLNLIIPISNDRICEALQAALESIDPSAPSVLLRCAASSSSECLQDCTECKEQLDEMVTTVDNRLQEVPFRARFRLAKVFGQILLPLLSRYQQDESSHLLQQLSKLQSDRLTWSSFAQNLLSINEVFALAHGTMDRGALLLGAFGIPMACKAIDVLFVNYLSHVKQAFSALLRDEPVDSGNSAKHISRVLSLCQFLGKFEALTTRLNDELVARSHELRDRFEQALDALDTETADWSGFDEAIASDASVRSACAKFLEGAPLPGLAANQKSMRKDLVEQITDRIFVPVRQILADLPKLPSWSKEMEGGLQSDLPAFGFMAQEYVTFLGQYLITLAHDLEPLLSNAQADFNLAFTNCTLPYVTADDQPAARLLLQCSSRGTAIMFTRSVSSVPVMSTYGRKQLLADAEYLCNLLEDLGIVAPDPLTTLVNDNLQKLKSAAAV